MKTGIWTLRFYPIDFLFGGGVKHSPLSSTQDCKIELGKVGEFVTPLPPKKINGVKSESFSLYVPVNLNSPFLLNLILP